MKVEVELKDLVGKVLLRPESAYGFAAVPDIGDIVLIESNQWEVAKRHFHYQANGNLLKVVVQCRENDL